MSMMGAGGNKSLKKPKPKPKKTPQRGLGVAQLEQIRMEELAKKQAVAAAAMAAGPPPVMLPPSTLHIHQNGDYKCVPKIERPENGSLAKIDVPEIRRLSGPIDACKNPQIHWSSSNLGPPDLEILAVNPAVAVARQWKPQPMPSHEPGHVWQMAGPVPRTQREQYDQMMNWNPPSARNPPSMLSNFQTEPPSSQNCHCNGHPPTAPEVNKVNIEKGMMIQQAVAGIKRPYPFPLDASSPPTLRPRTANLVAGTNESSLSTLPPAVEDEKMGELLTLAPPSGPPTYPNRKPPTPTRPVPDLNNQTNLLDPEAVFLYRLEEMRSILQQEPADSYLQRRQYHDAEETSRLQQGWGYIMERDQRGQELFSPANNRTESSGRKADEGDDREDVDTELRL